MPDKLLPYLKSHGESLYRKKCDSNTIQSLVSHLSSPDLRFSNKKKVNHVRLFFLHMFFCSPPQKIHPHLAKWNFSEKKSTPPQNLHRHHRHRHHRHHSRSRHHHRHRRQQVAVPPCCFWEAQQPHQNKSLLSQRTM